MTVEGERVTDALESISLQPMVDKIRKRPQLFKSTNRQENFLVLFYLKVKGKDSQKNCAVAKGYLNHTAPRFAGVDL